MKLYAIIFLLICGLSIQAKQASQKGATVNNKGAEIKNSKGGGVATHKNEVSAKSSSGKGVEANKKGMEVKGSKGGMTIQKKKLDIKAKNVNVHLGK